MKRMSREICRQEKTIHFDQCLPIEEPLRKQRGMRKNTQADQAFQRLTCPAWR